MPTGRGLAEAVVTLVALGPLLYLRRLGKTATGALGQSLAEKAAQRSATRDAAAAALGFQAELKRDLAQSYRYIRVRQAASYERRSLCCRRGAAWRPRFDATGKLNAHHSRLCAWLATFGSYYESRDLFVAAYWVARFFLSFFAKLVLCAACRGPGEAKRWADFQSRMFAPYYELVPSDNPRMPPPF